MVLAHILSLIIFSSAANAQAKAGRKTTSEVVEDSHGAVERNISVRSVEHKDDHRIRVFFSATEKSGEIRYPISTIDRSMLKVEFTNVSSPPTEALSLGVLGNKADEFRRALFLGFDLNSKLSGRDLAEVRSRVDEVLTDLDSEYLTVASVSQGSARIIAALPSEGEGPALSDTLCVAAEKFNSWNLNDYKASDQKILLIISKMGDQIKKDSYQFDSCWKSIKEQGIRVFIVSYGLGASKQSSNISIHAGESGGFVHSVANSLNTLAAIKNVISLLNSEYVMEVDAPNIALEDQPLEIKVKLSYHDAVIQSELYNLGFIIPTLSNVISSAGDTSDSTSSDLVSQIERERKRYFFLYLAGIALSSVAIWFLFGLISRRIKTATCASCLLRVKKDHSDCPFRKSESVARLVVIGGKYAGMTFPLVRGKNNISVFSRSGVKLPWGGIRWFNHGHIVIEGMKAAYTPSRLHLDRVNGWPVLETKLLGQGHVLSLGSYRLRLEIKPSSMSLI